MAAKPLRSAEPWVAPTHADDGDGESEGDGDAGCTCRRDGAGWPRRVAMKGGNDEVNMDGRMG
jgi:hypothetical protein